MEQVVYDGETIGGETVWYVWETYYQKQAGVGITGQLPFRPNSCSNTLWGILETSFGYPSKDIQSRL